MFPKNKNRKTSNGRNGVKISHKKENKGWLCIEKII